MYHDLTSSRSVPDVSFTLRVGSPSLLFPTHEVKGGEVSQGRFIVLSVVD